VQRHALTAARVVRIRRARDGSSLL